MALLPATSDIKRKTNKAVFRNTTRCFKLTEDEARLLDEVATSRGVPRSEWMRDAILRELHPGTAPDVMLAELLGVRLLMVNVLRPLAFGQKLSPEAFDKLLDEISIAKYELASKLTAERKK